MKTIKTVMFLLLAMALTACKQVTITAPTDNFLDDEVPATFAIAFTGGAPTNLKIQMNTTEVTDRFAVTTTSATASGTDLADVIYSGRNVFQVSANNQIKQVYFYYDIEGPSIRITDTDHENNIVIGYVVDNDSVGSVTLDGVALSLDAKNGFSTTFADQPVHTFIATDSFGHTSKTEYARNDTEFSGISARLNQGGLNFLVKALRTELLRRDFTDILSGIEPITLADFNIFGLPLFELKARVTELSFDDINLALNVLDNEKIDTKMVLDNFKLGLQVSGNISLLPYNSTVTAQMDDLNVKTNILMDIVDTDLDLSLSSTTVTNSFVNLNFYLIPAFLDQITSVLVSGVVEILKPIFIGVLEKVILPIASEFIKDIPIQLKLVTLDDGEQLRIKALPEFLDSNNKGITVNLATHIWAPEPPAGIPGALGSLYVEGETPTLSHVDPDGLAFNFGAAISANVINQAFLAAHEAGVTTMAIHPETYANATPAGIQVYASTTDIKEGAKIGMRIEPVSAPYIKFMPGTDGAPGKFGWTDVYLAFDLYKPEWGEYRLLFGVTFDLEVPFELGTTEDGYLSLGIEQQPTIFIRSTNNSGLLLIPPSFINNTLDYFMPMVLPRLAAKLKAVPLPRIYNHTLHMNKFWVAGSAYNNLAVVGDLIPLATTEAASAPSTVLDYSTQNLTVNQDSINSSGQVTSTAVKVNNGVAIIDVGGVNPNPTLGLLEHRFRVDGGAWSIWKHRETITLNHLLAGSHNIEICARSVLLKIEQGCPVVTFQTTVN